MTGYLTPPATGTYTFEVEGETRGRLNLNGLRIVDSHDATERFEPVADYDLV